MPVDPVASVTARTTVATVASDDDHVTVGFAIVLSLASFTVAVSDESTANAAKVLLVHDRVTELAT